MKVGWANSPSDSLVRSVTVNTTMKKLSASIQILRKAALVSLSVTALFLFAQSAQADNLIVNGDFAASNGGQLNLNATVAGWTIPNSMSYSFVYTPGSADTTGVTGAYGPVLIWGPNDGSANGMPATSPGGGNYIASDAELYPAPIQQTVNGLTVGANYALSFYWAGAQQEGFTGASTDAWDVTFGGQTQDTATLDNTSEGFTGWQYVTMDFTATSSSELLSFLAVGTPAGVPPFSLLSDVSLVDPPAPAPEPGTLPLLFTGLATGLGALTSRKWRKN